MTVWNKGDLALCIAKRAKRGIWGSKTHGLRRAGPVLGRIYTVDAMYDPGDSEGVALCFPEFPGGFHRAVWFRKIAGNPELLSKRERDWVLRDESEKEDV